MRGMPHRTPISVHTAGTLGAPAALRVSPARRPAAGAAFVVALAAVLLAACATAPPASTEPTGTGATVAPANPAPVLPGTAAPLPTPAPAPSLTPAPEAVPAPEVPAPAAPPAKSLHIALALGGGAARGFAHVGVIKALEARGVHPDIVVGTSVGSFVAALYAAGYGGSELEHVALGFEEWSIADWSLPARGLFKGEALQDFVNRQVHQRPIEKLDRKLAVVATDLNSGEMMVFERGNVGMAVRASSSVPGVFQPVTIAGHDYVDGGLVSPVPVRAARRLGADIVIAVDISRRPAAQSTIGAFDILVQTFTIMSRVIARNELLGADIVLHPAVDGVGSTDFESREAAIQEGERAVAAQWPAISELLTRARKTPEPLPAAANP